MDYLI